ncbi:MAG: hypothetical protein IJS15_03525 [Victivallales bacterium]|jgi:hypothetical protein|nr:hypothetical protein [Victivallales bacterium]
MGNLLGTAGSVIVTLVILGVVAAGLYAAFSKINIANTQQNLVLLRMNVQQFFNGTNYEGLTNEIAIKAGIMPVGFLRGTVTRNVWGGDVTLSPDSSTGQFSIELTKIPQSACTQLARFQTDSWDSIAINGAEIDPSDVEAVSESCAKTNSIKYTAR